MKNRFIVLDDVVKVYPMDGGGVTALRGVSLSIDEGEFISIMGPSGSGKTTLLNIIGGLDIPSSGKVVVDGVDLSRLGESGLEKYRLEKIGFIFQLLNLLPKLTVKENIEIPLRIMGYSSVEVRLRVYELMEKLGLKGMGNRLAESLSGGEMQRVAIAIALANDPPIILADEPTAELDSENIEKVMSIFKELNEEGKTIIVATHDPRVARRTDRIFLLEDGLIKGDYRPSEVTPDTKGYAIEYTDIIKKRIKEVDREIEQVKSQYEDGSINMEEMVDKIMRLKRLKEALKEELVRSGELKG
jgi:putative ABC transport system ATP-binding protein